ncbi:MAG: hypothetical protein KBC12_01430 [Candidatus Pacebacteria bacterium]|nr:hypothetical protein [Candidatus Paceibacterota bacterium]MBP9851469.1 hypothetical protein [Candidatus Paceibacterota bacterium]
MGAEAPDSAKFLGYKKKEEGLENSGEISTTQNKEQANNLETALPPFDKEGTLAEIIAKVKEKGLEEAEAQLRIMEEYFDAKRQHGLQSQKEAKKVPVMVEKYKSGEKFWQDLKEHPYGKYVAYFASESFITVPAVAIGAQLGIVDHTMMVQKAASRIGMNSFVKTTIDLLLDKSKILDIKNRIKNIFFKKPENKPNTNVTVGETPEFLASDATEAPVFESNTGTVSGQVPTFESSQTSFPVFESNNQTLSSEEPSSAQTESQNSSAKPMVFNNGKDLIKEKTKINPAVIKYGAMAASTGFVFLISGGTAALLSGGVSVTKEVAPALLKILESRVKSRIGKLAESTNISMTMSPEELLQVLEVTEFQYRKLEKKLGHWRWVRNYTETALDLGGCLVKWSGPAAPTLLSTLEHDAGNAAGKVTKVAGKKIAKKIEKSRASNN